MITVEELAKEICRIDDIEPEFATMIATGLLPFINRHIAGQHGAHHVLAAQIECIAEAADKAGDYERRDVLWQAVRELRRLATPKPAGAVPEVTPEMIAAGAKFAHDNELPAKKFYAGLYAAMSSAAPQPMTTQGEAVDSFVRIEQAVLSLPSGYAFADAVEHAEPDQGEDAVPSAKRWAEDNAAAVTSEWMAGWDACRFEYPHTHPSPVAGAEALGRIFGAARTRIDMAHESHGDQWKQGARCAINFIEERARRLTGAPHD